MARVLCHFIFNWADKYLFDLIINPLWLDCRGDLVSSKIRPNMAKPRILSETVCVDIGTSDIGI